MQSRADGPGAARHAGGTTRPVLPVRAPRRGLAALLATAAVLATAASAGAAPSSPWPPPDARSATVVVTAATGPARTVSPDLFGANLLWPNGAGGAFDAASGSAAPGIVALVRRLGVRAIRYPGGTTADSFHWQRAIGPIASRRPNEPYGMQAATASARGSIVDAPAPSVVGPDEFGRLLLRTGAVGDVVVNFATGSAREAADLAAYLTSPAVAHPSRSPRQASYWAALRAADGHPAPYPVPYFEVGNEQEVPAEYGWRSGALVRLGGKRVSCPPGATATCLYAFGGVTRFSGQPVGTYADDLPAAARSTGRPDQRFFSYYPPVVPRSEHVEVGGKSWRAVATLASAAPGAHVFAFRPAAGEIDFGDGAHGAIPPAGALVTTSYESGPHAGFVGFYAAMKRMDPAARICESEGQDLQLLQLLGRAHPYDCVVLHAYAVPTDVRAPLPTYEQALMTFPPSEGAALAALQRATARFAGHRVPVVVTEYGQPVLPMPAGDPGFDLSLDEALLTAAQLREWIDHGVALADKYLLASSPLAVLGAPHAPGGETLARAVAQRTFQWVPGLRIDSAMIATAGSQPVAEPTGLVLGLLARLAGGRLLSSRVVGGPDLAVGHTPALLPVAVSAGGGSVELAVVNTSPTESLRVHVLLAGDLAKVTTATDTVLDGPSATAYNTAAQPGLVHLTTRPVTLGPGQTIEVPAHSVSLLRIG